MAPYLLASTRLGLLPGPAAVSCLPGGAVWPSLCSGALRGGRRCHRGTAETANPAQTHTACRMEEPFWLGTVARMNAFALHPDERATAAARHFLEYPRQSEAAQAATVPLELHLEGATARGTSRGAGWRAVARGASAELVALSAAAEEQLLGAGPEQDARRAARAAASRAWWLPPGEPHPAYGSEDPLSDDPLKALPLDVNLQVSPCPGRRGGRGSDASGVGCCLVLSSRRWTPT